MSLGNLSKIDKIIKYGKRAYDATKRIATRSGRKWVARLKKSLKYGTTDYLLEKEYQKGLNTSANAIINKIENYKNSKKNSKSRLVFEPGVIPYNEAKVFVFTNISNYENVINNYKNRSFMTRIFVNRINKILDQELVKGSDVIAFKSISDLKSSGLIPRSDKFYKILNRNGSFYLFSGFNFYFIYILGNTNNLYKIIKNYFYSKIPYLSKKEYQDDGYVSRIKEALGIKKLSIEEQISKDKFEFIAFPTM